MDRTRILWAVISLLFIALAWWRVLDAGAGLVARTLEQDGLRLRYLAPTEATSVPGVLIAHGFAGSQQLMLGYAYTLARAGYGVVLWDFGGHAGNPARLDREGNTLQQNVDAAYAGLVAQPEIDPERVALLGHSMGSGAVMQAAVQAPQRYQATIAVSPTDANVTPERPRNLMLQAGQWESRFVANARRLLAAAGGENADVSDGRGRIFVLVPKAEHITILFNRTSQEAALEWLNRVFNRESNEQAIAYRDQRIIWYGVHLLAWLALVTAVSPMLPTSPAAPGLSWLAWSGLALAAFLAAVVVALVNRVVDVSMLGGLLVGGGLGLWFLFVGLDWLAVVLWTTARPLPGPGLPDVGWGLALFAVLWLAFGALGQLVWLPWWLVPARLWRWPLLAATFLPWLLASGMVQQGASARRRIVWWLGQSLILMAGLLLAIYLTPSLGFLFLVLPLLPLVIGVMTIAGAAFDRPWAYATGNALFFAWLILAVFPMA